MSVAIYARYSSDLQSVRSIEDQVSACRTFAQRAGIEGPFEVFADAALSGASTATRPQLLRAIEALRARRVSVLIAEALDRLSRDQADIALIHRAVMQAGARLVTISEGEVSHLHIGLAGTMNHLYLLELGRKTRRGLIGVARSGRIAGGRCYGYAMIEGRPGERTINESEAAIVRRIFEEYAGGDGPRRIVQRLNAEGVASPRGGPWRTGSILGDLRLGDGLLRQELYRGRLVFNRRRFIKDAETGRRKSVVNPESEWIVVEKPDLRIVEEGLWRSAQAQRRKLATIPKVDQRRRPKTLLSGLVRCAACGGSFIVIGPGKFGCNQQRKTGTCEVSATIRTEVLERRVLAGLKSFLLKTEMIGEAVHAYHEELAKIRRRENRLRNELERDLAEARRRANRIAEKFIEAVGPSPALAQQLYEAETRIAELEARSLPPPEPVTFHPGAADLIAKRVLRLEEVLNAPNAPSDTREALRNLITRIELQTDASQPDGWAISVSGPLIAILEFANEGPGASDRILMGSAGTRTELRAFGL